MTVVLCVDEHCCYFICDTEIWDSIVVNLKAGFNKYVNTPLPIKMFKSLFIGREDIYEKHFCNMKKGDVPACANEWVNSFCEKQRYKFVKCLNKRFFTVSNHVSFNHLKFDDGFCRNVIGTYVMLLEETIRYFVIRLKG